MIKDPYIPGHFGFGWKEISIMCDKSHYRKMLNVVKKYCQKYGWEYQSHKDDEDVFEITVLQREEIPPDIDEYWESTKKSVNESTGYSSNYSEPNPKPKGWDPEVHGEAAKIMLKEIVK